MYYAAQDIIEYLLASVGGGAQDSEHRLLRQAAHHAYRDLINARDWNWHVTTGTLTASNGEGSGDGVQWFTLPAGVKNVDSLIPPPTTLTTTQYVSPTEWARIHTLLPEVNLPIFWTVVKDTALADRWQIRIAGNPPALSYTYTYRRRPEPLRYMGYEPICRDPSFAPEGAVRRWGTAANYPEGMAGMHPFTAQEIIGLDGSQVGTAPTGAKTVVSDYLDVSDPMLTALLSGAELWAAKLLGKNVEGAMAVYQKDLRLAMESDSPAPLSGRRHGFGSLSAPRALGYYNASGPDN